MGHTWQVVSSGANAGHTTILASRPLVRETTAVWGSRDISMFQPESCA
jgi:hypothetical protein